MKSKFATFVDNVALSFLVGLLMFCWVNFVSHNKTLSTIAGSLSFCLSVIICYLVTSRIRKKLQITQRTQQKSQAVIENLQFMPAAEQISFLNKHINERNQKPHTHFIKTDQAIYFNLLLEKNLTIELLCQAIQEIQTFYPNLNCNVIILCGGYPKETKNFCKQLNIHIELWNLIETTNKLNLNPDTLQNNIKIVKEQKSFVSIFDQAFSPARFKHYCMVGIILIISSFFVPYKVYYLVFGSIMILFSILTLVLKLKNKNTR